MSNLPTKYTDKPVAAMAAGKSALYRDTEHKKVAGVCSGLAKWTGIPSVLWRLGFVLTTLMWGAGLPIYVIAWLVMDAPPPAPKPESHPDDLSPEAREVWDEVQEEMQELSEELQND